MAPWEASISFLRFEQDVCHSTQRPCLCQRGFISRGAGPEPAAHLQDVRLGHRKAFHTKVLAVVLL